MILSPTIYAVSSGSGRAGIAVVRVSGSNARMILEAIARPVPQPRLASLRKLKSGDATEIIDQALVLWFPGPNTVTGDDLAEFHVHGSAAVIARLFSEFAKFDNVRPADPGEFTRRAFENGRMDLLEVEGLADLLSASTDAQRRLAMRHYLGAASSVYENWRSQLLSGLAHIEAAIDFVEEEAVAESALRQVRPAIVKLVGELEAAVKQSSRAGAVRDGLRLVIAGAPNVGKSSLLNALSGRDAAIVAATAGTTRDVIETSIDLHGIRLMLADTAGVRDKTFDEIELQGIAKAKREQQDADILIWVEAAGERPEVGPDREPDLWVINKADLVSPDSIHLRNDNQILISVKSGSGLRNLQERVGMLVKEKTLRTENAVVVRDRHVAATQQTIRKLNDALADDARPLELIAEDLRMAAKALGSITGHVNVEDLLGRIFSEFCIGK